MGINMGMHPMLVAGNLPKRKHRWAFSIQPYVGSQANMLPPTKGARPNVSFNEYSAEHLNEKIYFPGKADWGTVDLTLYDQKCADNPIFAWMQKIYDPKQGTYKPSISTGFKTDAQVTLYDGGGNVVEMWVYKNAFPTKIEWGDLDMTSSDAVMVDITLRFDRAYWMPNDVVGRALSS